jgi:hypothetical protein
MDPGYDTPAAIGLGVDDHNDPKRVRFDNYDLIGNQEVFCTRTMQGKSQRRRNRRDRHHERAG